MKFQLRDGWVQGARKLCSPNHNKRPEAETISLLVIHNISLPPGEFGGGYVESFFTNKLPVADHSFFQEISDLQVSAHLFVSRQGEVTQFVGLADRAWHAGVSCIEGREGCNDFSIGIELEGTDDLPYTDAQYAALQEITRLIQAEYPLITSDRIVGHCDIAPDRKTDPGPAFDWQRFRAGLQREET